MDDAIVTAKDRYLFDVQGYLHLRSALAESDRIALLDEITRQEKLEHDDNKWNPQAYGGRLHMPTKHRLGEAYIRLNGLLRLSPFFDRCIDYPSVFPYLQNFMPGAQLGNSWSISKDAGPNQGGWHTGIPPGHYSVFNGKINTRIINTIFFLTDNGLHDGCVAVIPGSHKANFEVDLAWGKDLDLPGAIPVIGKAGDILIFTESLLHTGLGNSSGNRRTNLYFNHASPDFQIPNNPSIAYSYHYAMPPHIRQRFTERQKTATNWMAAVKTID